MVNVNEIRHQSEQPNDAPAGYEWYLTIGVVDRSGGYRDSVECWKLRPTKNALQAARWEAAQKSLTWLEAQGFEAISIPPAAPQGGYGWESREITSFALGRQQTGGYVRINSIRTGGERYYHWRFLREADGDLQEEVRWFKQHTPGGFVDGENGQKKFQAKGE